jgi:hypothetical protein
MVQVYRKYGTSKKTANREAFVHTESQVKSYWKSLPNSLLGT